MTHEGTDELLRIAFAILSFFASGLYRAMLFTCAAIT